MAIPWAAIIQMVGKAAGAAADFEAGKAADNQAKYQAYVAQQDARQSEKAGNLELKKAKEGRRRLLSRQIALAAAAGRDISGGSPLALMESSERAALLDEQTISYNKHMAMGRSTADAILFYGNSQVASQQKYINLYASMLGVGSTAMKTFGKKGGAKGATPKSYAGAAKGIHGTGPTPFGLGGSSGGSGVGSVGSSGNVSAAS